MILVYLGNVARKWSLRLCLVVSDTSTDFTSAYSIRLCGFFDYWPITAGDFPRTAVSIIITQHPASTQLLQFPFFRDAMERFTERPHDLPRTGKTQSVSKDKSMPVFDPKVRFACVCVSLTQFALPHRRVSVHFRASSTLGV